MDSLIEPQVNAVDARDMRYRAFLSYDRTDRRFALDLQRRLERYVLPAELRAVEPGVRRRANPLRPIFRDEDELVPGHDLSARIQAGLASSQYLLVVCSQEAARSNWVEKEVQEFSSLGRAANIIAVVVSGEPNAKERGLDPAQECLPPALRQNEPLWIDWRSGRYDHGNLLRIAAALLSLRSLDDLIRRDRRRRTIQTFARTALTLVAIVSAIGAGLRINALRMEQTTTLATTISESASRQLDNDEIESAARLLVSAHNVNPSARLEPLMFSTLRRLRRVGAVIDVEGRRPDHIYLNRNGQILFAADYDGQMTAWRSPEGAPIPIGDFRARVTALAERSGDPTVYIAGTETGDVWLFGDDGASSPRRLGTLGARIVAITASRDGELVVGTNGHIGHISAHDPATTLRFVGDLRATDVIAAQMSSNGELVSASRDSASTISLHFWHAGSASRHTPVRQNGREDDVACASISSSGAHLVTGSCGGVLQVWDTQTGRLTGPPLAGHHGMVSAVRFLPDENHIVSVGEDTTVRLWSPHAGGAYTGSMRPVLRGHTGSVSHLAVSADGRFAATSAHDGTIRIWDVNPRLYDPVSLLIDDPNGAADTGEPPAPAMSADGAVTALMDGPGVIRIKRDGADDAVIHTSADNIAQLHLSERGEVLAATGFEGITRVWTSESGWREHTLPIENFVQIALSDTLPLVAASNGYGRISLFNIEAHAAVADFPMATTGFDGGLLQSVRIDPTTRRVVATTQNGEQSWAIPAYAQSSGLDLVREVCDRILPGPLRILTTQDAEIEPALYDQIGFDVCSRLMTSENIVSSQ